MINIYTVAYIKPELIYLQNKYLQKYCKDNFTYTIINNGQNDTIKENIKNICKQNFISNIDYIKNYDIADYCSHSHCAALEFAIDNYIKNDSKNDITIIIDNDIFPFKFFSFLDIIGCNDVAGMYQQRLHNNREFEYLSAIFTMFRNSIDLSNFKISNGIGDTGSGTHYLISKYQTRFIDHTAQIDIESDYIFQNNNINFPYKKEYACQILDNIFIHYYRGSNWAESDPIYHSDKINFIVNFLENTKNYELHLDDIVSYSTAHADKNYNGIGHNYKNYRFNLIKV